MPKFELPEPDAVAKEHSAHLQTLIRSAIKANAGWLSFDRYMEMALYTPGYGYYSSGQQKFGSGGDFITAPEVSSLFGRTLANAVAQVLKLLPEACVMEFGAGSGKLACDVLEQLDRLGVIPEKYLIIELSAELRERQQVLLQKRLPKLVDKVLWLDRLPVEKINAVVIANEVLDAMPIKRFGIENNNVLETGIVEHNGLLEMESRPACQSLCKAIAKIENELEKFSDGYSSEVNLNIDPWLNSVSAILNKGAVYIIDYGYPRPEYYLPERHMGTLMCYYQQRAHDDVLRYPGLQDITAFVDFTAVAEAAVQTDFDVDGFTNQANFLLDSGLMNLVQDSDNNQQRFSVAQQVKTLTLPSEMGERFKVIGLNKNLEIRLPGFNLQDMRNRL